MSIHPTCEHGLHPYLCDLESPEMPGPGYDVQTRPYLALRPDRPVAPEPDWLDRLTDWVDRHALTRLWVLLLLLAALWYGGALAISLI